MENKRCVQYKKYSTKVKQEILRRHYEEGETSNALAREYNIPRSTVKNWFAKTNKGLMSWLTEDHMVQAEFLILKKVSICK